MRNGYTALTELAYAALTTGKIFGFIRFNGHSHKLSSAAALGMVQTQAGIFKSHLKISDPPKISLPCPALFRLYWLAKQQRAHESLVHSIINNQISDLQQRTNAVQRAAAAQSEALLNAAMGDRPSNHTNDGQIVSTTHTQPNALDFANGLRQSLIQSRVQMNTAMAGR